METCNNYVGIDLHKHFSQIAVIDSEGKIIEEKRINNNREELVSFFNNLKHSSKGVVEASGSWYWFVNMLKEIDFDITLAHPFKVKAIASAKIKTDKVDARILGNLLRADLIPMSYIPSKQEIEQRELLRFRFSLSQQKTRNKNQIHSILTKYNVLYNSGSDLFGKSGREFLKSQKDIPKHCQLFVLEYLELIEQLEAKIKNIDKQIDAEIKMDADMKLLLTIPGVGPYTAYLLKAEIGDINRFPNDHHLCSCMGLVPSTYQSGDTMYHGHITKRGNSTVRWALVQAAQVAVRKNGYLKDVYQDLSKRRGKQKAKVAVARRILSSTYFVLTRKQPYFKPNKQESLSGPKRPLG